MEVREGGEEQERERPRDELEVSVELDAPETVEPRGADDAPEALKPRPAVAPDALDVPEPRAWREEEEALRPRELPSDVRRAFRHNRNASKHVQADKFRACAPGGGGATTAIPRAPRFIPNR